MKRDLINRVNCRLSQLNSQELQSHLDLVNVLSFSIAFLQTSAEVIDHINSTQLHNICSIRIKIVSILPIFICNQKINKINLEIEEKASVVEDLSISSQIY